jgi:hypothetical protein
MKLRISKVYDAAPTRPSGYVEDVLSRGVVDGEWLTIPDEEYEDLKQKYRPQQELPSMGKMMLNAFHAAEDEVKARAKRMKPLDPEEIDRRYAICQTCEFFIADQGRCSKCGCFMKFKSQLRSQHCPEGKW